MTDVDDHTLEMLNKLKDPESYPLRDAEQALTRRVQFIEQVRSAAREKAQLDEIAIPSSRISRWVAKLVPIRPNFRLSPIGILAVIVLVTALLLTSGGITVAAAQASGPLDSLYPLKLAIEDFRLSLATNSSYKIDLLLEFTDRRIDEIVGLMRSAGQIPDQVVIKLEEQSQQLFQVAASVDDQNLVRVLNRLQLHWNLHVQRVSLAEQLDVKDPDFTYQQRLQQILGYQLELVETGQRNPGVFRQQIFQSRVIPTIFPLNTSTNTPETTFGPGKDAGASPCQHCTPSAPGSTQSGSGWMTPEGTIMPLEDHGQDSGSSDTPSCRQCGPQLNKETQGPSGTPRPGSSETNQGQPGGLNHP